MKRINDFLTHTKGMTQFFNDRSTEDKIKAVWGDVTGRLSTELKILYFREKKLYIQSTNPVWQAEVTFISSQIIGSLKKIFKKAIVDRVIVVSDTAIDETSVPPVTVFNELTLEELIKFENRRRLQLGMSLCRRCNDVHCFGDLCIFCSSMGG